MSYHIDKLREKAEELGALKLTKSNFKDKKWCVYYRGVRINFGGKNCSDYSLDPNHPKTHLMRSFLINKRNKKGEFAHLNKYRACYWALNLLWSD